MCVHFSDAVLCGVFHVRQYICETGAECPVVFKWSRVFKLHCSVQSICVVQSLALGLCCAVLCISANLWCASVFARCVSRVAHVSRAMQCVACA